MAGEGMTPEELEAWLNARPEETRAQEAVWIAWRAVVRVLPVLLNEFGAQSRAFDLTCLHACRSLLISGVAGTWPTPEIKVAAEAASAAVHAAAVDAVGTSTLRVVTAAADAVDAAAMVHVVTVAVRTVTFSVDAAIATDGTARAVDALASDVAFLTSASIKTGARQLWPDGPPEALVQFWEEAKLELLQGSAKYADQAEPADDWSFWINWYEGLLEGRPQNRALLTEIALIPDADWEKGSEHVNALIRYIGLKHAALAFPNAETLEVNPATHLIQAIPVTDINRDVLQDCLDRLHDASETFGDLSVRNNQYGALLPEVEKLREGISRYQDRPQRLYDVALQVARRVSHKEVLGECPEAQKDALVADFKSELFATADDIRKLDQKVQEVVDARLTEKLLAADLAGAAALLDAASVLVQATEGDLSTEMTEDATIVADPAADPVERRNSLYRFASRTFKIVSISGKTARGVLKEGAALAKDATIVIGSAVTLWKVVIPYLLSLL